MQLILTLRHWDQLDNPQSLYWRVDREKTLLADTHEVLLGFSEKILMMKSPSLSGSNVHGMMQYWPGGSL